MDFILENSREHLVGKIVNLKNAKGFTPAMFAASNENFDALNLLVEKGADLTIESQPNGHVFSDLIVNDFVELFECVEPLTVHLTRDLSDVSTISNLSPLAP
jgi:ankyrin repeat protein